MLKIGNFQQFLEAADKAAGIICFGAGRRMAKAVDMLKGTAAMEKVVCVIDNDCKKQGKSVELGSRTVKICSMDILDKYSADLYIILITCAQELNIISFFQKDDVLEKYDYYCMRHFELFKMEENAMQKRIPKNLKLEEKPIIPKTIHYCWFGGKPLPDRYKYWMESWHKFCPDYRIIEWNESNYDVTKNKYMLQAYENQKWGFVPDYARLDIIYEHGGIYLDTDVELVASLDELLYQKGYAGFESERHVAFGLGFGAIPKLKIIKEMRDSYNDMRFVREDGSLNMTASPVIQTAFLQSRGLVSNGEYQRVDDLTIYPEKVLCGKSSATRRVKLLPYTKAIHHFDGSWLEEEERRDIFQREQLLSKTM